MEKPASISTEKENNPALDFNSLRAEGIQAIQELTGAFWTDYNEHDPGVTILEQLSYAITDLSYRTNFNIQDHFYNHPSDDTILKPHEILPCNALTVNDYRKLIFDQVFELKNIWVKPVKDHESTFHGLYKILIDVDSSIKGEQNRNAVAEKTRKVFCNNRNVGEDLEEVKVLKHIEVNVCADVEVDGSRDVESILAEVNFKIDQYLSPEMKFYSLREMMDDGYEVNEIFDGPLLKHGFIKTSELQPKSSDIVVSELIKIIMQVPGVVSVKNLYLQANNERYDNQIEIPEDSLPVLANMRDTSRSHILFFRGVVNYTTIDFDVVKRKLNELHTANKRVYRLAEELIQIPLGRKLDIENYYSIQNQFPLIYGIGQYGLPGSSDNLRKAQAKQLKGYLLIFEQILANYLSQLGNVKNLFSLKQDNERTYFFQSLKNVPDVKPLLKERKHEFVDEQDVFGPSYLNYYSGLEELVVSKDNYTDRRNRFLNYLLSIHGESYTQYSLSQFNYYFNEEEFEKHLIQNKTRLLKSLSSINKNRFRAFNYLEPAFNDDNITGMEARISILLGLGVSASGNNTGYKSHSLVNHYAEQGIQLISTENESPESVKWEEESKLDESWDEAFIDQNFDLSDAEEYPVADSDTHGADQLLAQTLPLKTGVLPSWFLKEGIRIDNYQVGKVSIEDADRFPVVYKKSEQEYLKIADFETEKDANECIQVLSRFLIDLNIQSEGLHMVEHILLRPHLLDQNHGILIYDETGKPFLRSAGQYSFYERQSIINEIKTQLYDFNNYSVETTADKEFEVHFKTSDDKYHFTSINPNMSVEATHEKMESLFRYISDQDKITPFQDKIGMYVLNTKNDWIIPEDFFNCRISVLLPSWTARFSNKEFRSIIEDTIHENKPANIALNCFWLNPVQLAEFESVYLNWMDEKRNPELSKEKMDELNNQMIELLTRYKDECVE